MLLAFLLGSTLAATAVSSPAPTVALQPFGTFDSALLSTLAEHLRSSIPAEVTVLEPTPLPDEAFYVPRRRYRADSLLEFLNRSTPKFFAHVIGITDRDISVTKGKVHDWGVFGVAELSGRPGVVSTFRLRNGAPPAPRLQARLNNVVIHELGHTLGLPHCEAAGCVMQDAHGSIAPVDATDGRFCDACSRRLTVALR